MPAQKKVLVLFSENILNQHGFVEGLAQFVLTHQNITLHSRVFLTDSAHKRQRLGRLLRQFRPDGLLICVPWPVTGLQMPAGMQMVNIANFLKPNCPTVMCDQELAGRLAAAHLRGQGLQHFAFAATAGGHGAACRWEGFHRSLRENGRDAVNFNDFATSRRRSEKTDALLAEWIMAIAKPVGIHTYTMIDAVRVACVCHEQGLEMPGDVALLGGQDNPSLASAWGPAISAIDFDFARVGHDGLQLLEQLMNGGKAPAHPILVPPLRLIPRESSDMRSAKDPEVAAVRQWLRANAYRPITVKDVLARTPLLRRTLERRFRAIAGHGLHDEIESLRMDRARGLLRGSFLPVSQVAAQSGYAGYMTFVLAFRRANGLTPSAFRHRAKG